MLKLSVCIDKVFAGVPVPEAIQRVARAGFAAFEFWDWTGKDLDGILRAKQAHHLEISVINCSSRSSAIFKDWSLGCLTDPRNRAAFLDGVQQSVTVAQQLGCPSLLVTTGNRQASLSDEAQSASIVDGLRAAAPLAEAGGVTLLLEPLNVLVNHPGYFLSSSAEAARLIRAVGHPHVKLLFDIYHQQVSEGNVTSNITSYISTIGHFHVADVPGRHQPGTGELNFPHLFRTIAGFDFGGYVGLEYAPLGDIDASLAVVSDMQRLRMEVS